MSQRRSAVRVLVLGGINRDTIVRVRALPLPGETVIGHGLHHSLGGKGANQAIAVARTGTPVSMIGAVGTDAAGQDSISELRSAGVDTADVRLLEGSTGQASIWVADSGENSIVVAPGVNGLLEPEHLDGTAVSEGEAEVLLVQGEIPPGVSVDGVRRAHDAGARAIVNLAPFVDLGAAVAMADPLIVNEIEARQLLGEPVDLHRRRQLSRLLDLSRSAVVTLGPHGALVVSEEVIEHVPTAEAVRVVDTTGAGDAFAGVLAAALAHGMHLTDAVHGAVAAATLSVSHHGAGQNYPRFDVMFEGSAAR